MRSNVISFCSVFLCLLSSATNQDNDRTGMSVRQDIYEDQVLLDLYKISSSLNQLNDQLLKLRDSFGEQYITFSQNNGYCSDEKADRKLQKKQRKDNKKCKAFKKVLKKHNYILRDFTNTMQIAVLECQQLQIYIDNAINKTLTDLSKNEYLSEYTEDVRHPVDAEQLLHQPHMLKHEQILDSDSLTKTNVPDEEIVENSRVVTVSDSGDDITVVPDGDRGEDIPVVKVRDSVDGIKVVPDADNEKDISQNGFFSQASLDNSETSENLRRVRQPDLLQTDPTLREKGEPTSTTSDVEPSANLGSMQSPEHYKSNDELIDTSVDKSGLSEKVAEDTSGLSEGVVQDTSGLSEDGVQDTSGLSEDGVQDNSGLSEDGVQDTSGLSDDGVQDTSGLSEEAVKDNSGLSGHIVEDNSGLSEGVVEDTSDLSKDVAENTSGLSKDIVKDTFGLSEDVVEDSGLSEDAVEEGADNAVDSSSKVETGDVHDLASAVGGIAVEESTDANVMKPPPFNGGSVMIVSTRTTLFPQFWKFQQTVGPSLTVSTAVAGSGSLVIVCNIYFALFISKALFV